MTVDPAEVYRAALPAGEVEEFATTALDRVGVPVWSVTFFGTAVPDAGGHGYGATGAEARTGAFGELTEVTRSAATLSRAARRQASYADLLRELGPEGVADPRTLGLPAGVAWDEHRPLQWLPMRRERDGAPVLVPAELVASTPADLPGDPPPGGWLTTVITNGLGAGLDRERAVSHAVLEVLQRDGNGLTFRALDRGVEVDLDGLADPDAVALVDRLRAEGVDVAVKLAATDFGIANVYAVGADPAAASPLMVTACGEAAHPDRDRAVRKALLEFAAARTRKAFTHGPLEPVEAVTPPGYLDRYLAALPPVEGEEERALDAMVGWLRLPADELAALLEPTVLSRRSTVALTDLPTTPGLDTPAALLADLAGRLRDFDVLVADFPGDGVHAAKVVVPGLEVETMSYGRIGERNVRRLLDLGRDDLVRIVDRRPDGPGWAPVHLTPGGVERVGGPAWLDRAAVERVVGALYPLYREPGRHVAPLALAAGAR